MNELTINDYVRVRGQKSTGKVMTVDYGKTPPEVKVYWGRNDDRDYEEWVSVEELEKVEKSVTAEEVDARRGWKRGDESEVQDKPEAMEGKG